MNSYGELRILHRPACYERGGAIVRECYSTMPGTNSLPDGLYKLVRVGDAPRYWEQPEKTKKKTRKTPD